LVVGQNKTSNFDDYVKKIETKHTSSKHNC
jgi:hypothetical protein